MSYDAPKFVYSRDGKTRGVPTGTTKRCQMEGCTGLRVGVRWPASLATVRSKSLTWPCSKGLLPYKDGEKIQ